MSNETPARDFILPRLQQLIDKAGKHGIARDVAVAVLIDLVTGSGFNTAPLPAEEDASPAPRHDVGLAEQEAAFTERANDPPNPLAGEHVYRSDIRLGRRGHML